MLEGATVISKLATEILDGAVCKSNEGRKVTASFESDVIDIVEKYRGVRSFKETASILIRYADEMLSSEKLQKDAKATP